MKKGIACIVLSAFGFALMGALVHLADCLGSPIPTMQKAVFRNQIAAILAGIVFMKTVRSGNISRYRLRGSEKRDLFFRCVFGACGIFANFYAVSRVPLGDAMALNKTAPFFALMMSWVLLKERVSWRQAWCMTGAFLGALLVMKPGLEVFSGDSVVGLASGFFAGAAYAYLHRLGKSGVNGSYIVLVFSVFSFIACLPFVLSDPHPMTLAQLLALCGAGAAAALGQFGITWAYRFAEPRQVAVYDYSGVVFAALLGFAIFGQIPDAFSYAGFALIILSGIALRLI